MQLRIGTVPKCNALTLDSDPLLKHAGEVKCSKRVVLTYSNCMLKPVAAVDLPVKCKEYKMSAV